MDTDCVTLLPGRLDGCVNAPPSKSAAHRAILCAALAALTSPETSESVLSPLALSDDIRATLCAAHALGVRAVLKDGVCTVSAGTRPEGVLSLDCGESGSTLRFLIPIAAALGLSAVFTGHGRLPERPIGIYTELLPRHGVSCRTEGGLPLAIEGQLQPGCFVLPGNVSSQFITGLLLALPLLPEDSEIRLTTPLESAAYVDMTLQAMESFGVSVKRTADGWKIPGRQRYRPRRYTVEGDWSQAAFFLAAGVLGGNVSVRGLREDSLQGDKAILNLLTQGGARLTWENGELRSTYERWHGIAIDASQIPDLVPILAAVFSLAEGDTVISHAERLRLKESDRLAAMAEGLTTLGAQVEETPDGLILHGVPALAGGTAEGKNDHRVVMALAIAALRSATPCTITDAGSIRKSYPDFFQDYQLLGGTAHGSIIRLGSKPQNLDLR